MTRDDERPDLAEGEEEDAAFERRFRAAYDATPAGAPRIVMPADVAAAARRRRSVTWLGGALLAASAAFVAATVAVRSRPTHDATVRVGTTPAPARSSGSALQVALVAPGATRVTVVGDFNRWDPNASPLARGADGSWRARIAVPPGRHEYAFVVDDDRWVTDPVAPRAPGLGLGQPNSVAIVPDAAGR
jgi:hypothetical protein